MSEDQAFDRDMVQAAASIGGVEVTSEEAGKVADRLQDLMNSVHALDHLDLEGELPSGHYDPVWDDE